MKVITTTARQIPGWGEDLVDSKRKKFAAISIKSQCVNCPLYGKAISSMTCELCEHCVGSGFDIKSSSDYVKCSYGFAKTAATKDVEKKPVAAQPNEYSSIFAKQKMAIDVNSDEASDVLSFNKIKASHEVVGFSDRAVSEKNNSIFDPDAIEQLEERLQKGDADKQKALVAAVEDDQSRKHSWEEDYKKELDEIGYSPNSSKIRSVAHESKFNNPDISEYKFSIFDDIDKKVDKIPEKTQGETLKDLSQKRKSNISRDISTDDWESAPSIVSVKSIEQSVFKDLLGG